MTVISGNNNQCLLGIGTIDSSLNSAGKFDGIAESGIGTAGMMAVINSAGFNHQ